MVSKNRRPRIIGRPAGGRYTRARAGVDLNVRGPWRSSGASRFYRSLDKNVAVGASGFLTIPQAATSSPHPLETEAVENMPFPSNVENCLGRRSTGVSSGQPQDGQQRGASFVLRGIARGPFPLVMAARQPRVETIFVFEDHSKGHLRMASEEQRPAPTPFPSQPVHRAHRSSRSSSESRASCSVS